MRNHIRYILLLGLALLLCAGSGAAAGEGQPSTAGQPMDRPYRPLLVDISNTPGEARPAWGLSQADVVYEAIVNGPAHTRYLAIFNDHYPEKVGPLRSTRVYFASLRHEWDCPLVFRGEGGTVKEVSVADFFKQTGVRKQFLFTSGGMFAHMNVGLSRSKERDSPHNTVANLKEIVETAWPQNDDGTPYEPRLPAFRFTDPPSRGTESATWINVPYHKNYNPEYHFDPDTRTYARWYDGKPQKDAEGVPIIAANVIVMYNEITYIRNDRTAPYMDMVGSGPIDAFIDGTHIRGTWSRPWLHNQTFFLDEAGAPLRFLPGKTFIQIYPPQWYILMTGEDGAVHAVGSGPENPDTAADEAMYALFLKWTAEKGEIYTWSEEDRAAYDEAVAATGFERKNVPDNIDKGEMSMDQAVGVARETLIEAYGMSAWAANLYRAEATQSVANPNRPEWAVVLSPQIIPYNVGDQLHHTAAPDGMRHTVLIDVRSGRVLDLNSEPDPEAAASQPAGD